MASDLVRHQRIPVFVTAPVAATRIRGTHLPGARTRARADTVATAHATADFPTSVKEAMVATRPRTKCAVTHRGQSGWTQQNLINAKQLCTWIHAATTQARRNLYLIVSGRAAVVNKILIEPSSSVRRLADDFLGARGQRITGACGNACRSKKMVMLRGVTFAPTVRNCAAEYSS